MTKKKTLIITIALLISAVILSSCSLNTPEKQRITRMAEFASEKYGMNITPSPIEYGEENKERHSDIFGNGFTRDIPYYAVFPFNDGEIYVIERDGVLSDNGQLADISYMLGDYLTDVTGYEIEFVEVRSVYNGNTYDTKISEFLQREFNDLITEENIGGFFDSLCNTPDTQLVIYAHESQNQTEMLSTVTEKLSVFAEKETVREINLFIYSGELAIDRYDVREKVTDSNGNVDYSQWDYIFDYYYAVNPYMNFSDKDRTDNSIILMADMILDRGYTAGHGMCTNEYEMNGWIIGEF